MPVTFERFNQGLTYDAYKAQMTRNRDRLEANERTVELAGADVAFFAALPQPLPVLVLAEDWCGDVIANLPVLARLAAESGKLDLRIFLRDQNLDLMDQYLKDGLHRSIPVFVFFTPDFEQLGYWIERPARVSAMQAAMRQELFASDPLFADIAPDTAAGQLPEAARERLMAALGAFRTENRMLADHEVVRELRAIVEHGAAQSTAAPAPQPAATVGAPRRQARPAAPGQPVKVSITYCAECGYEPQTLALASALMYEFVHELASIELIPWQSGAFDVVINGELAHSMYRDGGFPEPAAIVERVREALGAPAQ